MADPAPGHTREGLALLFFNALVAKEHPEGDYTREYALDLLAEVLAAIDGKRTASERTIQASAGAEPKVDPIPELEAELAAERPVRQRNAPAARSAKAAGQPAKRGRAVKVAPPPPPTPARRGRPRTS